MSKIFIPGKPFVAVSGIRNSEELFEIQKIRKEEGLDFPVVIGWQVSHKTIDGRKPNKRQPHFLQLGALYEAASDLGMFSAFHYFTPNMDRAKRDLETLTKESRGSESPKLLQFNTQFPSRDILRRAKEIGFYSIVKAPVADKKAPGGTPTTFLKSEFQDFRSADPDILTRQIEGVRDLISYAMFDPSNGTGSEIDFGTESLAIRFGNALQRIPALNNTGFVYAGGLGPKNIEHSLKVLNRHFPDRVSVDAETKVRTGKSRGDRLDMAEVRDYLIGAREALAN